MNHIGAIVYIYHIEIRLSLTEATITCSDCDPASCRQV